MDKRIKTVVYISIAFFCIVLLTVVPYTHDLEFHLYRIGAMANELKVNHSFPIRILSDSNNGYGYGVPLFYGDMLLYIPAVMVVMGIKVITAYKIFICLVLWLTFLTMRYSMKRVSDNYSFIFLSAVFYTFSSYYFTDLAIRASVGETCSFIFIPIVFCSFYRMVNNPEKKDYIMFILGMSGLMLTHNITFVLVAFSLLVYFIVKLQLIIKKGYTIKIVISGIVIMLLTCSFWFPFIEAIFQQQYHVPGRNNQDIQKFVDNTLNITDLFFTDEMKEIIHSKVGINFEDYNFRPATFGYFLIGTIILHVKYVKRKKPQIINAIFWIFMILTMGLFIKPFICLMAPIAVFMQFPWRIMILITFGISIYTAYLLSNYSSKRLCTLMVFLCIIISFVTISTRYIYQIKSIINEKTQGAYCYRPEYNPNDADDLYLPESAERFDYITRGETILTNSTEVGVSFQRKEGKIAINCNNATACWLELPLYYYKGYTAIDIEEEKELVLEESSSGLVNIYVEHPGKHNIIVGYTGTKIQHISDFISLISVMIFIIYSFRIKRGNLR